MKTIETTQTAGLDKLLHLTIPVDEANRPYRVVVVVVPASEIKPAAKCDENEWPEGYLENTFGSIQDETFIRHPQCDRCLDKPQPGSP